MKEKQKVPDGPSEMGSWGWIVKSEFLPLKSWKKRSGSIVRDHRNVWAQILDFFLPLRHYMKLVPLFTGVQKRTESFSRFSAMIFPGFYKLTIPAEKHLRPEGLNPSTVNIPVHKNIAVLGKRFNIYNPEWHLLYFFQVSETSLWRNFYVLHILF